MLLLKKKSFFIESAGLLRQQHHGGLQPARGYASVQGMTKKIGRGKAKTKYFCLLNLYELPGENSHFLFEIREVRHSLCGPSYFSINLYLFFLSISVFLFFSLSLLFLPVPDSLSNSRSVTHHSLC